MVRIESSFAILLTVLACQSTTTTTASPGESNEAGGASSSVSVVGGEGGSDPVTEVATTGGNTAVTLKSKSASTGGSRATPASSTSTHRGGSGGVTTASATSSLASGGTSTAFATSATGGIALFTLVTATGGWVGAGGSKATTAREPDSCHDWQMTSRPGEPATLQDVGLCYEAGGGLGRKRCEPGGLCSLCELTGRYRMTLDCDRDGICETNATTKENCGACGNVCDSVCEPSASSEWYSCQV